MAVERTPPRFAVLVVDADHAVKAMVIDTLERAGRALAKATDSAMALELAATAPKPYIALVDWELAGSADEGVKGFLTRLRAVGGRMHLVIMATSRHKSAMIRAVAEGLADEHMLKPFGSEALLAHVERAERILAARPASKERLPAVLNDAAAAGGGEVVVRKGDSLGRVFFDGGQIVWATLSTRPSPLTRVLSDVVDLDPSEAERVLERAKREHRNFVAVLVDEGIVTLEQAKSALRRWIRETMRAILALEGAGVAFAPRSHGTWSGPKFSLSEVLSRDSLRACKATKATRAEQPHPCACSTKCGACRDAAEALETDVHETGADGIAIVHGPSGTVLGGVGEGLDERVMRAGLHVMGATSSDGPVDDVVVSAGGRQYHFSSTGCPDTFVCIKATKARISLAAIQHESARLARRIVRSAAARRS